MFSSTRKAPRSNRSFRPQPITSEAGSCLEGRISAASAFYWDPLYPIGTSRATAGSTIIPADTSLPPSSGQTSSLNTPNATAKSSLQNVIRRHLTGPPPFHYVDDVTVKEEGESRISIGLLPVGAGGTTNIQLAAYHTHTDTVTANAGGPYWVGDFNSNPYIQSSTLTSVDGYRFKIHSNNGVFNPNATVAVTASVSVDPALANFKQIFTLKFESTHLNIDVGAGGPNSNGVVGIKITDPSRGGLVVYSDPNFGITTFSYTMTAYTDPAQASESFSYSSTYATGPWGYFNNTTASETTTAQWTVGMTVNGL